MLSVDEPLQESACVPLFRQPDIMPNAREPLQASTYRARYYDPTIGRFLNEDPISFGGGVNSYRYVANSPTEFVDPYGLAPVKQQDMNGLQGLLPGSTPLGPDGLLVPLPCDQVRNILEHNGYYSNDNF